jgi:hypothetical protein
VNEVTQRQNISELLARVLTGAWRQALPALEITAAELTTVTPALLQTGAGALGWRRVHGSCPPHTSAAASELLQAYRIHAVQAVLHELQIKDAVQLLRSHGVEPIVVKGWSIARMYVEPGLRPYGDIDLCVNPDQYLIAKKLVADLATRDIRVDLHEGFVRLGNQSWNELHSRSRCLEIDGVEVRTPGPEDHLRLLCFHFLREGAWRPLWLCDVAVATETRPADFDWNLCFGTNETSRNYVVCTLLLAKRLLQANLDGVPDAELAKKLPAWLLPAVLKEWRVRSMYQRHRSPLTSAWRRPITTLRRIRSHWPGAIEATVTLNSAFDETPRWPLQVRSSFRRVQDFLRRASNAQENMDLKTSSSGVNQPQYRVVS